MDKKNADLDKRIAEISEREGRLTIYELSLNEKLNKLKNRSLS
jgi:hypothetical protein